jgi:hypothetical protein
VCERQFGYPYLAPARQRVARLGHSDGAVRGAVAYYEAEDAGLMRGAVLAAVTQNSSRVRRLLIFGLKETFILFNINNYLSVMTAWGCASNLTRLTE